MLDAARKYNRVVQTGSQQRFGFALCAGGEV